MNEPLAVTLARSAVGLRFDDIPPLGIERTVAAIVDCVGCILSGSVTPSVRPVLALITAEGGTPEAAVFGTSIRVSASAAALANGTAGHSLDYDDMSDLMLAHPSVALVPAIFALAEAQRATGREIICAYVAGFEAAAALAQRVNPSHYAEGWHATSTLGTIAAAVASAKLLGLDEPPMTAAIGIAASQAAGLRGNFGTDTKPLHAGLAARGGVTAARLAAAGMTANPRVLEGANGFFALYARGAPDVPAQAGDSTMEIIRSGMTLKPYACCGQAHTAIDAVLQLADEHASQLEDVIAVDCAVNRMSQNVLIHHEAKTPLEAKFCLEYCVAVALLDGECGLAQFTENRVRAADAQEIMRRVTVSVDRNLPPTGLTAATVTLRFKDGHAASRSVHRSKGTIDHPLSVDELRGKFATCARQVLARDQAQALLESLEQLAQLRDTRELAALLVP
jgi:2-methylcitrate dehydratase PrpD